MGLMQWLVIWLILNALFVLWRAFGVSYKIETRDRSSRDANVAIKSGPSQGDLLGP